jgi:hypothetical protein
MNDRDVTVEILNELLQAQAASLLPRLSEATPFISWAEADEIALVRRLIAEERAHQAELGACIASAGGALTPVLGDITSADVHYLALDFLLPRIIADKARLARVYEAAASRLAPGTEPGQLVAQQLEAQRNHLAALKRFNRMSGSASATAGNDATTPAGS